MRSPRWRQPRLVIWLALTAVLAAGGWLHSIKSDVTLNRPDDALLREASARVRAGDWSQICMSQHIHFLPLYRLVRLPFDGRFPDLQSAFHVLVVAAHLGGALALFLLVHESLRSPYAALAATFFFACSTVGDETIVWKAASPFVFSWTFLLLGLWLLIRHRPLAAAAALLAGVGFFSGALLVIPGILVGVLLLCPRPRRFAMAVCAGVGVAGVLAWLVFVLPRVDLGHYWTAAAPSTPAATRLVWAVADTTRAYVYQLFLAVRLLPEPVILWSFIPLTAALLYLRRQVCWRLPLSFLALTLPLLLVMLLIRKEPEVWKTGRYVYQAFTMWAVTLACLLDAVLARLEPFRRWRQALVAALPVVASLYLAGHAYVAFQDRAALLKAHPPTLLAPCLTATALSEYH